ncbi:ABC transporter substrate-binding protein [Paenibacillus thermoaerophilus]|uniref:ABC transporter substrate-binding protein n=1 Tax=Paenibacillus thermoaerophilus TaxID=1215385 RepID=A0ABW2V0M3_9BACL|nr:sugar ABC transporter substrate-binding protein [Paenibacillus thermoaerophilus]TMV17374.1 sugar ABC transporter substrate-binding protein [Paenibacillus thermoaerophilus]
MLKKGQKGLMLVSMAMLVAAAGCGGNSDQSAASNSPSVAPSAAPSATAKPKDQVTIKFMQYTASGSQEQTLKEMIAEFEKQNPDVKVQPEVLDFANYYTKLNTVIASGEAPDVFEVGYENFVSYAAKDVLYNLNDVIASDKSFDAKRYKKLAYDAFNYKGGQYGVVQNFSNVVLFYNKDLFDKAKVEYPKASWTWKEELEAAKKLTDEKNGIYGTYAPIQFWEFYKTIAQNGGGIFTADGKPTVNSPQNVEALNWMLDKARTHKVSPALNDDTFSQPDADLNAFKSGKIAMLRAGIWNFGRFADANFKWDIALEPGNTNKAHHFFTDGLVVSKRTKNAEAAWRFVKFMTSSDFVVNKRIEKGWSIPAIDDDKVMDAYYKQSAPPESKKVVLEALDSLVLPPVGPIADRWNELTAAVGEELDKARLGAADAQTALNNAQAKVEKLLK